MISTLLFSIAFTTVAPDLPLNAAADLRSDGIELVARATPTRFAALNPSDHSLVLLFADRESGAQATLVLSAGSEVEYRFASGALQHLELEVLSAEHGAISASGAIDLAALEKADVDALWLKRNGDATFAFAQVGLDFRAIETDHHLTRQQVLRGSSIGACALPHVPVITPTRHQLPDKPPKLEKWVPPF
jgi:hypothetical protein